MLVAAEKSDIPICQTLVKMSFYVSRIGESVYAYRFNGYWKTLVRLSLLGNNMEYIDQIMLG